MTEAQSEPGRVAVGAVLRWSCRYSREDLREFAELSGREDPDAEPEWLPDLLVIAPLTKLGGDLNYISRQMTWTMHRAVRPDEEICAELEVTALDESGPMSRIEFAARILDLAGGVVLSGTSRGLIHKT